MKNRGGSRHTTTNTGSRKQGRGRGRKPQEPGTKRRAHQPSTTTRARPPVIQAYLDRGAVIADSFAGGGGASLGIELALGRSPDVAINHDAEAIAMHAANHPETRHYIESVYAVDPREACGGKPCQLLWLSPDCKHHSKAKGGEPRDQKIRGLAWIGVTWAQRVKPSVIVLENVEEFQKWGPLHREHTDGCTGDHPLRSKNGRGRRGGTGRPKPAVTTRYGCLKPCRLNKPIKAREGQTFTAFVNKLERLGYEVEHRLLRACDYGAPTTRRRLFLVARRDGHPIVWPAATHGRPGSGLLPYRTAAECIDWSIPCPSIFGRKKPLADKTLARIARGVRKFVLESGRPFIVPVNHGGAGRIDHRVHSADDPLRTVTGSRRGSHAVAVPYMVHLSNGERPGQDPRTYDIARPMNTIVAQGIKQGLCTAFLAKHYGGNESTKGGTALEAPIDTITSQDHHALVAANVIKLRGTSDAHVAASGSSMDEPLPTISAQGNHLAAVSAFLVKYYGADVGQHQGVEQPLDTVTTKPRFGLVTVEIEGETYAIVDIGMRMLEPRELYRAQGFGLDDSYLIDVPGPNGKPLSKTAQIRMVGNSVSPPVAAAVIKAQFMPEVSQEAAPAPAPALAA